MAVPPPVLRDLSLYEETCNFKETGRQKVWKIGVPAEDSLYSSILLSYLLACNDDSFSNFIGDLSTNERSFSKKLLSSTDEFANIKSMLYQWNPFENRYAIYFQFYELIHHFKEKLNQFANKNHKNGEMDDDITIKAAVNMLHCDINVYFPEEDKIISLSNQISKSSLTLVLFQYKEQKYEWSMKNINLFHFSMSIEYASSLRSSALKRILEKAKLPVEDIQKFRNLVCSIEVSEEHFISTILQSTQFDILQQLYKSPYIALKLSTAGFETNPTVCNPDKPSPFYHAAAKSETKYIRMLYNYAANCCYLFEGTVRNPNDATLESLKRLQDVITKDKSYISTSDCNKDIIGHYLNAFSRFNKYQQRIVSAILNLKQGLNNIQTQLDPLSTRKHFISKILKIYLTYFYYNETSKTKSKLSNSKQQLYHNYVYFYEYYETIDSFSCLFFFDAIYRLKETFQLKDKNIYDEIESTFLLLIQSTKEFPKYKHDVTCCAEYCATSCQNNENILLFTSFLQRETLNKKIRGFLKILKQHHQYLVSQIQIKRGRYLYGTLLSCPAITEEFIIIRLKIYLQAAAKVSFPTDGVKGILVIERAIQVLGESIKHDEKCAETFVVTSLLGCRIPLMLIKDLIFVRNLLSHYHNTSATERLAVESNFDIFKGLQKELRQIQKCFEVVAFTQHSRLERYLVENCIRELIKRKLDEETIGKFIEHSSKRLNGESYSDYYPECINLSVNIINYLIVSIDYEKNNYSNSAPIKINEILNSIKYVFNFLYRNVSSKLFQPYLEDIKSYINNYKTYKNTDNLICDFSGFLDKYRQEIGDRFRQEMEDKYRQKIRQKFEIQDISYSSSEFQNLESFLKSLKQNKNSTNEMHVIVQAVRNAYSEATNAKDELKNQLNKGCITFTEKENKLMEKLIIPKGRLNKLKDYFKDHKKKAALKLLKKPWDTVEFVAKQFKKMLKESSDYDKESFFPSQLSKKSPDIKEIVKNLFIKMAFQGILTSPIYTSTELPKDTCENFKTFHMKKVKFLLSRIKNMKSILIDDDDEIKKTWKLRRNKKMTHHLKYLLRQKYLREILVRSSLEMAFFDCLNILNKTNFFKIYEKVDNLFTGINLRNVLSHGHSVLETVGGLLDKDDFPSELINKILELIDDSKAIITMENLIPESNTLDANRFISWIESNKHDKIFKREIKMVTSCPRWKDYLFLLPLITQRKNTVHLTRIAEI